MAIAFSRYVDGTASASSTTASVDLSPCSAGNLAFVLVSRDNHPTPTTTPSGWTLLQSHTSAYDAGIFLYAKELVSGDVGVATWTWASSVKCLATAAVYTNAAIVSSAKGTLVTGEGTTADCGSITSSNTWLAQFCSGYTDHAITYDALSGYTERREHGSTTPMFWQLCADTAGTWVSGACAPDFTCTNGAFWRGGFIVEMSSTGGTAAPVLVAERVGASVSVSWT
jgi:hypothetical protein